MGSVIYKGVLLADRPLQAIERAKLQYTADWDIDTLDGVGTEPGVIPAMRTGNPTTANLPYRDDFAGFALSGPRDGVPVGSPVVSYQPWGYGEWGFQGPWGEWEPKMLQLRSATNDVVLYDPDGVIEPVKWAIALRLIRYTDTGSLEYILECGEDGFAWLRLYVDVDDLLYLSWSFNGALPQVVASPTPILPGQIYLVSCDWQHTSMSMRVDRGEKVTGLRDVPQESWGDGLLKMRGA